MTRVLRSKGRVLPAIVAAVLSIALLAPCAVAQESPAASTSNEFCNYVELYLLLPWISGTVDVARLQTQIDVNASDVLGNLKFAALADYRGEARKWAVLADVIYMNVGGDGTGTQELSTAEVDVKEFIAELDGAWRISKSFELLAGGRYTHLRTTVTLTTPGSTSEAKIEEDWFDPIVGAQAFLPLSKAFQLQMRGDVGGFHVGSNFTWQAIARVNWQVSRVVSLGIGYRWLDQDFETGSGVDYFRWDVLTQGPLLAGGFRF